MTKHEKILLFKILWYIVIWIYEQGKPQTRDIEFENLELEYYDYMDKMKRL